jgi:hypothetical protein
MIKPHIHSNDDDTKKKRILKKNASKGWTESLSAGP